MKNKSAVYEFDPVVYPFKIWVVVGKNPEIITEEFKEYKGTEILNIATDVSRLRAFSMMVCKKCPEYFGAVIFFRSKTHMTYELVAHESSHAAKYLFEHVGADMKEHEPFEYVIGWIAGCIEGVKKGKGNILSRSI